VTAPITAHTKIAGVVGAPINHSLSPRMHNAWIQAARIDAVYLAFGPREADFENLIWGLRGGVVAGLNITIPFKERALALADRADPLARAAGAANLLLFGADGTIEARNTDGEGLLQAFRVLAPHVDLMAGPVTILGAGGAARGAAAALLAAGTPQVRVVNRTLERARALADQLGEKVAPFEAGRIKDAVTDTVAVINATSLGLGGGAGPTVPWSSLSPEAAAMDMVYKPLTTEFLRQAKAHGLVAVDGLEMLIRQAIPSFHAMFGVQPPAGVDTRQLLLAELESVVTEYSR